MWPRSVHHVEKGKRRPSILTVGEEDFTKKGRKDLFHLSLLKGEKRKSFQAGRWGREKKKRGGSI